MFYQNTKVYVIKEDRESRSFFFGYSQLGAIAVILVDGIHPSI